ncbi:MAG: hypothetical protein KF802_05155 [Bdellovibrionaceae bacterium]|nr:hypothetical protein [Pseudobdellovibrionaceae bacterium]MBX3032296.1 hypothetical protein [Pseudobdellovibrionaceae bacterium]
MKESSSQSGQIVIEYILLLVVAVAISAILVRGLASRSESSPGIVVERWKAIQKEIGEELPDKCVGDSCNR